MADLFLFFSTINADNLKMIKYGPILYIDLSPYMIFHLAKKNSKHFFF